MIYTDLEPDSLTGVLNIQNIDLNKDSIIDLYFTYVEGLDDSGLSEEICNINTEILVLDWDNINLLNENDILQDGQYFNYCLYLHHWNSCDWDNMECQNNDSWCSLSNKYIGLRLIDDGNYYYGWTLMKDFQTINAFAINTVPNQFIFAGQGNPAKTSDNYDFQDGRDLNIKFNYPYDEENYSEYRFYVVKSEDAENFDVEIANNVEDNNFISFIPNQTNFDFNLNENSVDIDGELVAEFIPYKVFVMQIANEGNNILLPASKEITLISQCQAVNNLDVTSENIFNGNYNLNVSFDKVENEQIISEYRIYFADIECIDTLNLELLNSVETENYSVVNTQNSNYSIDIEANNTTDIFGNQFDKTKIYKAVVMTVNNEDETNVNSFSISENSFQTQTKTEKVNNFFVKDIYNNNQLYDLEFSFDKVENEEKISEYRIIIYPYDEILTLEQCNLLPNSAYGVVYPTSEAQYRINFQEYFSDAFENEIICEKSYRAYVLSVADGYYTDFNLISEPSNIFSINNPNNFFNGYLDETMTYVDIEPDEELFWESGYNQNYGINIRNKFFAFYSSFWPDDFHDTYINGVTSEYNSNINFIHTTDSLNIISSNFYMDNFNYYFWYMEGFCNDYNILPKKTIYQPFEIIESDSTILGWVRLKQENNHLIICDYAYTQPFLTDIETYNLKEINIYPNPFKNEISIKLTKTSDYSIEVYNIDGKKVYSSFSQNSFDVNLSFLPSGIYILNINNESENYQQKIIKL